MVIKAKNMVDLEADREKIKNPKSPPKFKLINLEIISMSWALSKEGIRRLFSLCIQEIFLRKSELHEKIFFLPISEIMNSIMILGFL